MRRRISGLVAVILLLAVFTPGTGAHAATEKAERTVDVGIQHIEADKASQLKLNAETRSEFRQAATASAPVTAQSVVGDEKPWLGADFIEGFFYFKDYTLRAVGNNVEVWVASDEDEVSSGTDFPADDCRNGERTTITDEQVSYLVDQFDNNILPKESETFSVAPDRDGSNALLPGDFSGDGDDTVVLVDNVRDDNFYDTNNSQGFSYVAGFFSSAFGLFFDRNVMTIDAFDWLHRTGDNPPHEPTDNLCTSAPARPNLYEGVFAHEYQHLLLSYVDPAETTWMNEGLADWAQTLTGYVDPSIPITELGHDSHIQCFLGWLGVQTDVNPIARDGGPENSLNLWGDQNDFEWEILCDYGAAYTMMELLADRFGEGFMGDLHQDEELQGFASLDALLAAHGSSLDARGIVDRWAAVAALDGVLDDGANLKGGAESDFQVSTLDATINWDTIQTFSTPGAPPNGSDYVRLRDGEGSFLSASDIERVSFDGVNALPPLPIDWAIDADPPGQPGDPALHSTDADSRNSVIVQEVDVPAGTPALTFDAAWDLETTFDFGYVQITDDGGETYTSLECTDTVDDTDPDLGNVGPGFGHGFNGFNAEPTFQPQTCDLTPWAGQTDVGLAFRYFSDSNTHGDGFWVDDVMIGETLISDGSSFEGWQSATQFNNVEVERYTVRVIAYGGGNRAFIAEVPLDEDMNGVLTGGALRKAIGFQAETVAAIVTYHDSTELVQQYAPYTLRVNGVVQPGG
ncbi:MAG: peptidase M6 [Actinomycetota bacterium]